jgi:catechol 2,3-dioxygenase-like lactoylglutathione lyase family enzyme
VKTSGFLEAALYVDDMERSAAFYTALFGFERIVTGDRLYALAVRDAQVLLLFKRGASAALAVGAHDATGEQHVAFAIPAAELDAWTERLARLGVTIEETKRWDRGGTSLYFRDPDRHLIELATPGVWSVY